MAQWPHVSHAAMDRPEGEKIAPCESTTVAVESCLSVKVRRGRPVMIFQMMTSPSRALVRAMWGSNGWQERELMT